MADSGIVSQPTLEEDFEYIKKQLSQNLVAHRNAIQEQSRKLARVRRSNGALTVANRSDDDGADQEQSEETAEGILPDGAQANNTQDDTPRPPQLFPKFLMIIAPEHPIDSMLGKNEIIQRKTESKFFLETAYGSDAISVTHNKVVDSYADMLREVESFFCYSVQPHHLPIVLFFGHGSPNGKMCFVRDRADTRNALYAMDDRFQMNRNSDMPSCQLRVIFTQCCAHLVDSDRVDSDQDYARGEMHHRTIEYLYMTNPENPETFSTKIVREPNISSLLEFKYVTDLHLELFAKHSFVTDAHTELQSSVTIQNTTVTIQNTTDYLHGHVTIPPDLKAKVEELRKKMKMFLHVSFGEPSATNEEVTKLTKYQKGFEVVSKVVTSRTDLCDEIHTFLNGPATKVTMPVILVTGRGYRDDGGELMLVFTEAAQPPVQAATIFSKFKHVKQLRIVFSCYLPNAELDISLYPLYSNAVPPTVESSRIRELQNCVEAVIGDSDLNKTTRVRAISIA